MVVMIMTILLCFLELSNSVPYDAFQIEATESIVLLRILNSSLIDYTIIVTDDRLKKLA